MRSERTLIDRLFALSLGLDLSAVALLVAVDGYRLQTGPLTVLTGLVLGLAVLCSVLRQILELWARLERWPVLRRQLSQWMLLALALLLIGTGSTGIVLRLVLLLRQLLDIGALLGQTRLGKLAASYLGRHHAQLLALSFASVILLGVLCLTFCSATTDGRGASFLEALFTSTSATCVTGLAVRDTGTYFTRFGQTIILCLIQVGGLGIMTLSGSAAVLLGRRLNLRSRSLLAELMELSDVAALRSLMAYVLKMAFAVEAAGAFLLFVRFALDMPAGAALYQAVFHSISAFCNAGFSTWGDSLTRYRSDVLVNAVVSSLIIIGGLGFTVVAGLTRREGARSALGFWARSSAHVKMTLPVTALLLALGATVFYFVEYESTLAGLTLPEKLLASWFSSVTARTAGFNTVDMARLSGAGILLMLTLMFIGGAPGSTAGGIKVTTAGVLLLSIRSMLAGRHEVEAFGRTIPKQVVYRATAIAMLSFLLVVTLLAPLLATQSKSFEALLFEAVSAFGTVGLSMDVTPGLTVAGRLLVVVLMYIGRIGPLTVAIAIGERPAGAQYRLPPESILVG